MKNISGRFTFIVEPYFKYWEEEEESIALYFRVERNGKEYFTQKRIPLDFMESHFDNIFNTVREEIRELVLKEVVKLSPMQA